MQEAAATPAVSINATFLAGSQLRTRRAGGPGVPDRAGDRPGDRAARTPTSSPASSINAACRCASATTRHTMTLSCTCLAEDFEDVLAIRHRHRTAADLPGGGADKAASRGDHRVASGRGQSSGPRRRGAFGIAIRRRRIHTAGAPKGPSKRSSASTPRDCRVPRRAYPPVGALARGRRRCRSGACRRLCRPARSRGGPAPLRVQSPLHRRAAAPRRRVRTIAMPGKVADRHRIRLHHDQPARSAAITRTG